jgi:uncharacterized membrane protein
MDYIKIYFISVPVFLVVDLLWLGVLAKDIYQKYLGYVMRPSPNWGAAILFYLFFLVGLLVFVLIPAVEKGSWQYALYMGAFFGFITYMTYELTNYAVLDKWPWQIVIIDIVWGIVLSSAVAVGTYFVYNFFR